MIIHKISSKTTSASVHYSERMAEIYQSIKKKDKIGLEVTGCHFHLAQNVWRHIQDNGLSNDYKNDENFEKLIRMLAGLAYLPPGDVEHSFETVFDPTSPFYDVRGQSVFDYFEDTYIGRPRRRGPRH